MHESEVYLTDVDACFKFLEVEYGYQKRVTMRTGLHYKAEYCSSKTIISISYEPREQYLHTVVQLLFNGELPDYDDKVRTILLGLIAKDWLADLPKSLIRENNDFFSSIHANSECGRELLNNARKLRLCLLYDRACFLD